METKNIEIHQRNMYCTKCINNVIKAITRISNVKDLDIDMLNKTIKIKYSDCQLSKREIQNLINKALTTGNPD